LGRAAAAPRPGSRSLRGEAALLRTTPARVSPRLGAEGAPRSPRRVPRARFAGARPLPGPRVRAGPRRDLPRRPEAATCALHDGRGRRDGDDRQVLGAPAADRAAPPAPEAAEEVVGRLRRSVASRVLCDVPWGCLLSGGIDSSLVTALAAEASSAPVKTFAIGFDEPTY